MLRVDFVNDRVYRHGSTVVRESVQIDNPENILANKLCAVVGRDEPKDVFDLATLLDAANVDPGGLLGVAGRKCTVDPEELEHRLFSFPPHLLTTLTVTDEGFRVSLIDGYESFVGRLIDRLS